MSHLMTARQHKKVHSQKLHKHTRKWTGLQKKIKAHQATVRKSLMRVRALIQLEAKKLRALDVKIKPVWLDSERSQVEILKLTGQDNPYNKVSDPPSVAIEAAGSLDDAANEIKESLDDMKKEWVSVRPW